MASPLLGYNNNFRHKNRTFHVQTEDSGVKHPHIITHLFADGGRIVKSVKTSYAEYIGNAKMADIVREMMKQQHKAMIIALRDGQYDHLIEMPKARASTGTQRPLAGAPPPAAPPPAAVTAAAAAPLPGGSAAHAHATHAAKAAAAARETPAARAATSGRPPADAASAEAASLARGEDVPDTTRTPHQDHELTLDIDALERAASASETDSPLFTNASDLPPPPENLFREKTATGGYKSVAPPPSETERPPPKRGGAPGMRIPGPPGLPGSASATGPARSPSAELAAGETSSDGRYGNARPAAIFGSKAKLAPSKSLFGEDLISDKSLDEVILSYLAEDLDPHTEKK